MIRTFKPGLSLSTVFVRYIRRALCFWVTNPMKRIIMQRLFVLLTILLAVLLLVAPTVGAKERKPEQPAHPGQPAQPAQPQQPAQPAQLVTMAAVEAPTVTAPSATVAAVLPDTGVLSGLSSLLMAATGLLGSGLVVRRRV